MMALKNEKEQENKKTDLEKANDSNKTLTKRLVEEKGRLELPGRPLVYGTTPEFLRCFGVESLDELPELPKNEPLAEENHEESEKVDNSDINSLE